MRLKLQWGVRRGRRPRAGEAKTKVKVQEKCQVTYADAVGLEARAKGQLGAEAEAQIDGGSL